MSVSESVSGPAYRIGGREAGPDAFYAAACDPQRSVVIEACAGAGKTWMLVSRILRALLAGAEPQQILAITFTRKAAGEMRERLDQWLAEFASPAADDAQRVAALRQRGLPAAEAIALAPAFGALHGRLLAAGRAVEVRTFHGWFAQLVTHAPMQLLDAVGLPPRAELLEDTSVLRPALFRRFHRAVQDNAALRQDYLALVREHRRSTLLQWLNAAWQRSTELECAIAAGTLDHAVPAAASVWPELAGLVDPRALILRAPLRDELDTLARQLGSSGKAMPQRAAAALQDAMAAPDVAAAFAGLWNALFTGAGTPRKHLGESLLLDSVRERLALIGTMCQQDAAHRDHARMARLARVLLAEFAALKRQRGLADMADLERAALAMLGDSAVAGWVQERLDQRVRHVLIDEFQDTSPLQWQALHGWLSSYAGAGGGLSGQRPPSVFIVGDPKQSIYRFRRADPRVFDAARDFVVDGLDGLALACDHTRRNAPAVMAALNTVFDDAQRLDGWGPFRAHTTDATAAGRVQALPGVPRPEKAPKLQREHWRDSLTEPRHEAEEQLRQQEAALIADGVAALMATHGVAAGDVMVLSRTRRTLRLVADALAQRQLPHVAPENLALAEAPEALDLAALLDVLASPGHDLSLARALKSPLFGASDADLLWLMHEAQRRARPWLTALLASTPAAAALLRAQALLHAWLPAAATLAPHDLLDRIVGEGELLPRLAAVVPAPRRHAALRAVHAVLAAALEHDGGRYASVYAFVRAFKAGLLQASGSAPVDAVQLLTVHGAKGLEARAVFIADADPAPRPAERATLLVDWPVAAAAPLRVAFVRSEARVPPSLQALRDDEMAARAREELNGLYVAMTRAREWLTFGHTEPHRRGNQRSWWQRVEALTTLWRPPSATADATADATGATAAIAHVPVLPRLQRAMPPPRRDVADDPAAARLGQAVHRALEWLGRPGAPFDRAAWPAVAAAAAAGFASDAAAVLGAVRSVLDSPDCSRFFGGPALRWAGNEVPLADGAGMLRIDRLVHLTEPDGPTWWVLDYKLNTRPAELPAHRAQMARYMAAVAAAQPGERVRGGFITGRGDFVDFGILV